MNRGLLQSVGLLAFRVAASAMLFCGHGLGKIIHFGEQAAAFSDPIGLGPTVSYALVAFAEGVCTVLVALGIRARWAAAPILISMLVAGLVHHAPDPFGRKELALLYAASYLLVVLVGPGRFTLDALFSRKRD
jgi:putative oxidoreductase